MNGPALHLALNHVPVVVPPFVALLLAAALWRRSRDLAEAGFLGLVIVAVLTVPAFKTGGPAADALRGLPHIERHLIHDHAQAGEKGLLGMELLGILGFVGLRRLRRSEAAFNGLGAAGIIGTIAISGWMGWVGHIGGLIRHPEISSAFQSAEAP